jgi:phosphatidylglycerophosphate synthase
MDEHERNKLFPCRCGEAVASQKEEKFLSAVLVIQLAFDFPRNRRKNTPIFVEMPRMNDGERIASIVMVVFGAVLFVYFALSVLIFRLKNPHLKRPQTPTPREHSFLLHYVFRQWWYHWARPIAVYLTKHNFHPNTLTYMSVVFAFVAMLCFAFKMVAFGGFFVIISGACDSLDGWLARETGTVSPQGAFLDSTLDRFGELLVFLGLGVFFRHTPFLYSIFLLIMGAVMVSYARARGQSLGVDFNKGLMQRPERIVYISGGAIFDPVITSVFQAVPRGYFLGGVVSLVALLSLATAIFRTREVFRLLRTQGKVERTTRSAL